MKTTTSVFLIIWLFGLLPCDLTAQTIDSGSRRPIGVSTASDDKTGTAAGESNRVVAAEAATLESAVSREGLRFYLEIRNSGLTELAKSHEAMVSIARLLSAGPLKTTQSDLVSFATANLGSLSNARIGLAQYSNGGVVAIEAATAADAERLQAGVASLMGRARKAKPTGAELVLEVKGRIVLAGSRETVSRLGIPNAASLADDQEFLRARARFEHEQLFAFLDLSAMSAPLMTTDIGSVYPATAVAALGGMPSAIAVGGSIDGDTATIRALMFSRPTQTPELFSALFSSIVSATQAGQPMAAAFAAPDSDLFVDVVLDWDKLYETLQSLFAMFAGAVPTGEKSANSLPPNAQNVDLMGMLEASLGFSIKNDLIPTLGNELAFSLSGFDRLSSFSRASGAAAKSPSPRFMLIVAVKDAARFETLITQLISRISNGKAPLSRTSYRGMTISANKDLAFTIVNGFFIAGGSALQIRRAIDSQSSSASLASTDDYRSVLGAPGQATVQVYLSPSLTNGLFESLAKEVAKTTSSMPVSPGPGHPIGIQVMPDAEGMMIEARLPANLTWLALASLSTGARTTLPGPATLPRGVGIGEPGPRQSGGSTTPRMTDDDLRRRP